MDQLKARQQQDLAQTADHLACGPGRSFCKAALDSQWGEDLTTAEGCAVKAYTHDNDSIYNYWQWQPKYSSDLSKGNAFLNSSVDTNRFAGQQVRQESFLQGRGQVTSAKRCLSGKINYLPETLFQPRPQAPLDMSLFAQPSVVPRSCASLTEVNLLDRIAPLPGAPQGIYTPFAADKLTQADRRLLTEGSWTPESKYKEGVTLSTKKIPSFREMKAAQDRLRA